MKTQHTPPPWTVKWARYEPPGLYRLYEAKKANVTIEEHEANARLMEAAPDLLEACLAVVDEWPGCSVKFSDWPEAQNIVERVQAAIDKAKAKP